MPTIVRQFRKWSNRPMLHKKLPHLIYFALATNYFDVFMSTTDLLRLTSFEKMGGQWILMGASNFSNLLAPLGQWLQELNVEGWSTYLNIFVCSTGQTRQDDEPCETVQPRNNDVLSPGRSLPDGYHNLHIKTGGDISQVTYTMNHCNNTIQSYLHRVTHTPP